jgi:hypothetical protein
MQTWWLSFADPDKLQGMQFLGVAVVEAPTYRAAITKAWATGCNPGGEIEGYLLPDASDMSEEQRSLLARTPFHTLLSREQLIDIGHIPE